MTAIVNATAVVTETANASVSASASVNESVSVSESVIIAEIDMQSRIANGIEIATVTVTAIKDVAIRSVTAHGTENGPLDAIVMEMPVGGIMKRTSREHRDVTGVDLQMIRVLSPIETGIGGCRMTIQTSGDGTRRYDVIGIAS